MVGTKLKTSLSTMSPRQMLSLWWQEKWVRGLVLAISPIGLIDTIYTLLLFQAHGPEFEYNPFVRLALTSEWLVAWVLIDVISFAIFSMIAGSYYLHTRVSVFENHTRWLSGLVGLRVGAAFYNIFLYYEISEAVLIGGLFSVITYIIVEKLLSRDRDLSIKGFKRYWRAKYDRIHDYLLMRQIKKQTQQENITMAENEIGDSVDYRRVWLKRAFFLSIAIVVFVSTPFILVALAEFTGGAYMDVFYWTRLAGRTFIFGFFMIILLIGAMLYFVLRAFYTTEGAW
jgi:hypothetical protein